MSALAMGSRGRAQSRSSQGQPLGLQELQALKSVPSSQTLELGLAPPSSQALEVCG